MDKKNISDKQTVKVGITHGDFNGISYEIILKALMDKRVLDFFCPVIYGSSKIASYYRKNLNLTDVNFNLVKKADFANPKRVNIVNVNNEEVKIEIGKESSTAGELAYLALEKALDDLKWGKIDVLVTAPIHKKNIQSEQFKFKGHTDFLASKFESNQHLMLMVSNNLRIGMITEHVPLKDVPSHLSTELIFGKIEALNNSLIEDFNINKPKIAVLGLNPHASDGGIIGNEEQEVIIPSIQKANENGILTFGPFAADGFFASDNYTKFDAILAMYHDQGMLPFKTFAFESGVNYTAGLPFVRTSPAHGTAYDIAGKNIASPDSLRAAIFLAVELFKNRSEFKELANNPLKTEDYQLVEQRTEQKEKES